MVENKIKSQYHSKEFDAFIDAYALGKGIKIDQIADDIDHYDLVTQLFDSWLSRYKPREKVKVYIASPYTLGDVAVNVKAQLDVADQLMTLGFAPFAPLYSHFQHMAHPRPYIDWIKIDLEWVESCDCVLRLKGESKGADGEVAYAKKLCKPIFYSIEELIAYYK